MKKVILMMALPAAFLLSNRSEAQVPGASKVASALPRIDLGIKACASFSQMSGNAWTQSYRPGIAGGIFAGVYKGKAGIQAECMLRSARFDYKAQGGFSVAPFYVKTSSLDVPLLFEYKVIPRVWIQAGPQLSKLLAANYDGKTDIKSGFKTTDVSGVAGLQVKLPAHLVAGVRYILGFSDINNSQNNTTTTGSPNLSGAWHNRSIQAYAGFRFL